MSRIFYFYIGAIGAAAIAQNAWAHATLEVPQAKIGAAYKAVIRISHGCEGSPTTQVKVKIPEGFIDAKPMPKAGWTVDITQGVYVSSYKLYGHDVSQGAKEITWSGGNLPDDFYDEFVLRGTVAAELAGTQALPFIIDQLCVKGAHHWAEIPVADAAEPKEPAAMLTLVSAAPSETATVYKSGTLQIEKPWVRATPAGADVAGGFVHIVNNGTTPDRLIGVESTVASMIEVHEMTMNNGVMKMRKLDNGLVLEAGKSVDLTPDGYHIMFMHLKAPLKQSEHFEATLVFEHAGKVPIMFSVEAMGAKAAPSASEHQH